MGSIKFIKLLTELSISSVLPINSYIRCFLQEKKLQNDDSNQGQLGEEARMLTTVLCYPYPTAWSYLPNLNLIKISILHNAIKIIWKTYFCLSLHSTASMLTYALYKKKYFMVNTLQHSKGQSIDICKRNRRWHHLDPGFPWRSRIQASPSWTSSWTSARATSFRNPPWQSLDRSRRPSAGFPSRR